MQKIMLPVLIALLLLTGKSYANKALSDSMKTEIRKVSAIMYAQGNLNYIDADALCDDIIMPDTWYDIYYHKDGTLTINDKNLPASLKEQYLNKLKIFLAKHNYNDFSTRCDGMKLADVFNEKSTFRVRDLKLKSYVNKDIAPKETPAAQENSSLLIDMLTTDHLVDAASGYHVMLSPDGLFVNGQKIDELTTQRYLQRMAAADPKVKEGKVPFIEITHRNGDATK